MHTYKPWAAVFLFLITVLITGAASGQISTETAVVAEIDDSMRLISPRNTVRIFINAMKDFKAGNVSALDLALGTLYLDDIPEENRSIKGVELADQLFQLLNAFTFKIDAIPVEQKGKVYVLPVGGESGIEIALYLYNTGEWKFNYSKTLSKLSSYLEIIEKSQKAQAEDSTIDPELFSPRQTMSIFLDAMNSTKSAERVGAARTLDLSRFERAVRREIGAERIAMLKAVMDRYKYINLIEIPNDRHGPPFIFLNNAAGRIVLEKVKNEDSTIESWKFSAQTIADLPRLYDAYKDQPLVEGVINTVEIPVSVRIRDYMRSHFPGLIRTSFVLENWQWLGIFCVVFLGLGISRVLTHLLGNAISFLFMKEAVAIDSSANERFITPINVTLTTLLWWMGFSLLGLPGQVRLVLVVTAKVITAAAGIWAGYRLMDVVGSFLQGKAEKTENKFDDLLVPLVTRALKTLVIIFGLIFIADIFAIDIDKVLAGLGLGGLAFALAAKDTISNIFGSLTILIDRPFQIGDWVTIGSADGTVESVGVRSTRIRTFYNSLITIPNSELINAKIDNWGARQFRRITTTIGIAYDTPPEKIDSFCEAIRELIRKHPFTRKDFFLVYLNEFSASSLGILLYCFVKTPDWATELQEKHRLYADIIRIARELKVEFAFPTQTLYLRNQEAPVHNNVPLNELAAFTEGRATADKIIHNTLGNPPVKPPLATGR